MKTPLDTAMALFHDLPKLRVYELRAVIAAIQSDAREGMVSNEQLQAVEKERDRYKAALEFYADPGTYFAMSVFPDPPCGEFVTDFSDVPDWGTRPGKRAREALQPAQKEQ